MTNTSHTTRYHMIIYGLQQYIEMSYIYHVYTPSNNETSPKVGSMLDQRRRRWANIEPTLGECLVRVLWDSY